MQASKKHIKTIKLFYSMIVGLTGTIASGKTTVAEFLKEKGFEHHTYSDILRKEAKKRGIEPTRENLQALGNKIKKESHNLGILSKMIIESANSKDIIADGIRTADEIRELRKYGALIIGIDAPQRMRFERVASRKRKGDPLTFEQFKEIDDHENKGKTEGQHINSCLKESDFVIINDSPINELRKKVGEILAKWEKRQD
jgi:dephospho-CoA kinase